jgi:hypothetical protein
VTQNRDIISAGVGRNVLLIGLLVGRGSRKDPPLQRSFLYSKAEMTLLVHLARRLVRPSLLLPEVCTDDPLAKSQPWTIAGHGSARQ